LILLKQQYVSLLLIVKSRYSVRGLFTGNHKYPKIIVLILKHIIHPIYSQLNSLNMYDQCAWCNKEIQPGKGKKSYKGKGFTMKVLTLMFGKSYCCERCRNSAERRKGKRK